MYHKDLLYKVGNAFVEIDMQRISVPYELALSTADIANFDHF